MTEYQLAWLELIATRDDFYMLLVMLVGSAAVWHKMSRGRLMAAFAPSAMALVIGLLAWGALL